VVAGSQALVAGDRWSVAGAKFFENTGASYVRQNTQGHQSTDHRPPTTGHLPCSDSSPACLQTLGDLAVQHSRELAVLKQAIQLQKKMKPRRNEEHEARKKDECLKRVRRSSLLRALGVLRGEILFLACYNRNK
jgi:hypothetical protein